MRQTYLDTPEDMQWLRDVHCQDMPADMSCAILYGNEDAPEKVEAWRVNNPHHQAPADYAWPVSHGLASSLTRLMEITESLQGYIPPHLSKVRDETQAALVAARDVLTRYGKES